MNSFKSTSFALLALFSWVTPSQATLSCTAISPLATNDWCNARCNNIPPDCTPSLCSCVLVTSPTSTASHTASPTSIPTSGSALAPYDETHSCCSDTESIAYFINAGSLYYVTLDINGQPQGSPALCASFVNAVDLALTSNGGIFVADLGAALVSYVPPNCGPKKTVVSWTQQQIPAPETVAIAPDGTLRVGSSPSGLYKITLDSNFNYVSQVFLPNSDNWLDQTIYGNNVYVVVGNQIKIVDINTGATIGTFFNGNTLQNNVPDIQDVAVTQFCGLFFAVPDSNQVWHCTNPMDGSSCSLYCSLSGADSVSCTNIWSPWGVAFDCDCNVYVTNEAGGTLVRFTHDTSPAVSQVLLSGLNHPKDVVVYVPQFRCGCPAAI